MIYLRFHIMGERRDGVCFIFILSLMSLLHTARLHITYCLVPIICYFASGEGVGGGCQFIDPASMFFHALGWNVTTTAVNHYDCCRSMPIFA